MTNHRSGSLLSQSPGSKLAPDALEKTHTPRRPRLGWFHRYPARFAPDTVERMLRVVRRHMGSEPGWVLDPFAGTGTAVAAARQMGIDAIGLELSHLGLLIAHVRLQPPEDLVAAEAHAVRLAKLAAGSWMWDVPEDLIAWLGRPNARRLSHFLLYLHDLQPPALRRWLELAVSCALRPSSKWLPGSIKPQVDPSRDKPPAITDNLLRAARLLSRDCRIEQLQGVAKAVVLKGDGCSLPFRDRSIAGIVTSPPYASTYDYFDVQRLSYLAFDWPREVHLQVGRASAISADGAGFIPPAAIRELYDEEYRSEATIEGRRLRAYLQAMERHAAEARRVVRPGARVAYAVANSLRGGRTFDLVGAVTEVLRRAGFVRVSVHKRRTTPRRILPAGRDRKSGRFSSSANPAIDECIIYASCPR